MGEDQAGCQHPQLVAPPTMLKTPIGRHPRWSPCGLHSITVLSPSVYFTPLTCNMEIALWYIPGFLFGYSNPRNDLDRPTEFFRYAFEILNSNNLSFQKQSQSLLKCKKYILILPCTCVLIFFVSKINHSLWASPQFIRATLTKRFWLHRQGQVTCCHNHIPF